MATASGPDILEFEDRAITPGAAYTYHLALSDGSSSWTTGAVRVSVPLLALFELETPESNAFQRTIRATFSLPGDEPARLGLFDVTGRRMVGHDVTHLGSGRHVVDLQTDAPAGVYMLTLEQGSRFASRRVTVLR